MNDWKFPTNLKYLREQNKLSREQFGKKINVSDKTIGNWERGDRNPEAIVMKQIADIFDIDIDDLYNKDLRVDDKNVERIDIQTAKSEIENILNNSDMSEQQKMMVMTPLNYMSSEEEENDKNM